MDELRADGSAAFDAAWRPGETPMGTLALMTYYRDQQAAIKAGAGWVHGDDQIRERIRIMNLIQDSDARVDRQEAAEAEMRAEAQRRVDQVGRSWMG
jgi:hypothetical protein